MATSPKQQLPGSAVRPGAAGRSDGSGQAILMMARTAPGGPSIAASPGGMVPGIAAILGTSAAAGWLVLLAGLALAAAGTRRAAAARRRPPLAAAYPAPGGWPATPTAFAAALSAWQRANPATRGPAPVQSHGSRSPV
jgi:hypothetical protein